MSLEDKIAYVVDIKEYMSQSEYENLQKECLYVQYAFTTTQTAN